MPPKGSGKLREEDFNFRNDRTEAQCKVCAKTSVAEGHQWLKVKNAARHLDAPMHTRAVEREREAERDRERLEQERKDDSASTELRGIQFSSQQYSGPVASAASREMTEEEANMWEDYRLNGADFSAGDGGEDTLAQSRHLRQEAESFGLWNPEATARKLGFGPDEAVVSLVHWEWRARDIVVGRVKERDFGEPEPFEIQGASRPASGYKEWFPYPSKMVPIMITFVESNTKLTPQMFLLDTLDNLPRLRISSSLMRVFLWVLKEIGCKDVPSFDHLRKVQKELRAQCGIPTIPCKSVQGNVFFMNDPTAIIAKVRRFILALVIQIDRRLFTRKDWANPTTRKLIHVYPEIPEDGVIREIWHAQKWRKNMDLDILSPMYDAGISHYYVNEVSRLRDGQFVIPIRWVKFRGKVYADAFSIRIDEQGEATIIDTETSLISSHDLTANFLDLEQAGKVPRWGESTIKAGYPARMPKPCRTIAAGRPIYCSFVNYFSDDVSGNRTKSWNKHWNAYMTHVNLPRQILQQEFHIHFVSTSPHASVPEQFQEFKAALEVTHTKPIEIQDELGDTTCLCIHANTGPSDNPMQSEISAHIGGKGNCPCRKCQMGGTQGEKATNNGYHAIFEAGEPRTKEHIIAELEKQVKLACSGVAKHVKDSQTETGVKDTYTQFWIEQLISRFKEMKKDEPNRSATEIQAELVQWTLDNRDKIYSPFLKMKGFDPTRDTPVEILHTILLGVIKYIWHLTHTPWSEEQKKTYAMRLQSSNTDGLSIHAIRSNYIMQYAGSLIGRQFKTLAQTNLFHVRGLVSEDQFMAWKVAGELSALLWFPEIRNLAEYRRDLTVAVANVLDVFATLDPSKIISKIKYHLLVHTDEDVVQFGPIVGLATELFESFNAVFQYCSILSNHLAPSRDIAIQLADQEGLKHRLTGGWGPSGSDGKWRRAGPGVLGFMAKHPILQRLVGWAEKTKVEHGDIKLRPVKRGQKERENFSLGSTTAARAVNYDPSIHSPVSLWRKCVHVISESLDECLVGSWVIARSPMPGDTSPISGRISDILANTTGMVLIVLDLFQVLSSRDEVYGMPVLERRHAEVQFSIFPAKDILFKFNAQHDCFTAKCEASGVRLRMQERVESDKTENYIVHKSLDRFLINSHAFHNAHLLRATLPRDLLAPIPLFPDRRAKHDELADQLREQLTSRKARAATKKRQREEGNGEDGNEETGERPQKKKKTRSSRAPRPRLMPPAESMISTRARRTIIPTEKAKAARQAASDSEEAEDSAEGGSDQSDTLYGMSDGNESQLFVIDGSLNANMQRYKWIEQRVEDSGNLGIGLAVLQRAAIIP
ncbi:hypothetical protein B0H17DRAFT_1132256 [Mycena rosella]|uniref:Uncharacterized protein n=1 Tax=Mycena rosella TaxID=1033263 RepID=A0AAD7DMP0_MYCRO|nr:hypothetical protein B0H17DRAFT_1132256 [Mycena rosella]